MGTLCVLGWVPIAATQTQPIGSPAGALLPRYGIAVDGVNNITPSRERRILPPPHWSTARPYPTQLATVPEGCQRSGGVVTCKLQAPPPSPGLIAGGGVQARGCADASFDGIFTIESRPEPAAIRWRQKGPNASSAGCTLASARWPVPEREGATYTDPVFGSPITYIKRFSHIVSYSTYAMENLDRTRYFLLQPGPGIFQLFDAKNNSHVCEMPLGEGASPRWSRTDPKTIYWAVRNELRRMNADDCSSKTLHRFKDTAVFSIGGQAGDLVLAADGVTEYLPGRACSAGVHNCEGQSKFFRVELFKQNYKGSGPAYSAGAVHINVVDDYGVFPDGSMVINYATGDDRAGPGEFQGMAWIRPDGTYGRQVIDRNYHMVAGPDANGQNAVYIMSGKLGLPGPCSGSLAGVIKVLVADSSKTCLWNLANASEKGEPALNLSGGTMGLAGHWLAISMDDSWLGRGDAGLPVDWLGSVDRGAMEAILCKTDASVCYRMAHIGGTLRYRQQLHCAPSMVVSEPPGSAPKHLYCSNAYRELIGPSEGHTATVRITVR